jgi:tetratricopeptide (TPR) repeat protein
MRLISASYEALGDLRQARAWLYKAIGECPGVREPYLAMARFGYRQRDWVLTYAMALAGLAVEKNSLSYLVEPEAWSYALYDLGAGAAYNLGLYDKARELAAGAVEKSPDNARLQNNLTFIEEKLEQFGGR